MASIFGAGSRFVSPIQAMSASQVEAMTVTSTPGANLANLFLTKTGTLMGQFENNAPIPIADLSGRPEAATGVPAGSIFTWMGYDAPPGYLLCDGSSQSTSTYTSLFAAIGNKWGSEGSGSFNVPNLAGRVMVGAGTPDFFETWDGALTPGATGGQMEVELTNRNMPEHSHSLAQITEHTHTVPGQTLGDANFTLAAASHSHSIDFNSSEPYDSGDADAYVIDHFIADTIYVDDTSDASDLKTTFTSDSADADAVTFDASNDETGAASIDDLSHHHKYENVSDWEMWGLPTNKYDTVTNIEGDFQFNDLDDQGLDAADTMFVIGQNDAGSPADDSEIDDTFTYSDYTTSTGTGADGLAGVGSAAHTHSLGTLSGTVATHSHTVPSTHIHKVGAAHHHSIDGGTSLVGPIVDGSITVPETTTGASASATGSAETGHTGEAIPEKVSLIQPYVCVNYIIKV